MARLLERSFAPSERASALVLELAAYAARVARGLGRVWARGHVVR
jgi:hypothetical protein